MKAKTLAKKIVVAVLVVAVIVLAFPLSALFASAEDPVFPEVGDLPDFTERITFVGAHDATYKADHTVTIPYTGESECTFSGIEPKETGKIYQTVKMTFSGNVNYNADGTDSYGRNGFIIGHYTASGGTKSYVTISYRRNQGAFALWDASSSSATQKIFWVTKKLDEVTIAYQYDIDTTELTLWFNGAYTAVVNMATQFPGFTPDEFGYSAVVMGNNTANAVTFSDMKVFGDWQIDSSVLPTKDDFDGKDYSDVAFYSTDTWQDQKEADGTATVSSGSSVVNGILLKENGTAVFSIKATFNGNVNFNWNGSSYAPTYGRIGFQMGTYMSDDGYVKPLFANFRRCQGTIYLMDNGDALNGNQGNITSICSNADTKSNVTELTFTYKYDSEKNKISIWINGSYIKTLELVDGKGAALDDFVFGPGFALTGAGTSDTGTAHSVTLSDMQYYGDLEPDDEVIAPKLEDYTNLVDKLVFGSGAVNKEMKASKTITNTGDATLPAEGVLFNEEGFYCIGATMTFKGNTDFTWDTEAGDWKNGWGKYGLKIGTYIASDGVRRNVIVSFRRCTANAYLFDDSNTVLGSFGGTSSTTVESLDILARYKWSTNSVSLWVNGKFLSTVSLDEKVPEFIPSFGFVTQGSGADADGTKHSTVFSNIRVYGNIKADPSVYVPELEPYKEGVTENLARYINVSGVSYFNRSFSAGTGTYSFSGLANESNGIFNMTCDIYVESRDLDDNGKEKAWTGPRFGFAKNNGDLFQASFMVGSTAVLRAGGGCGSPSSPKTIKTGETKQVALQYNYQENSVSVWLDGDMILMRFKLPEDANGADFAGNVTFEGCRCTLSNLRIWGTGMYVDIDEDTKALLNDPAYNSKAVPAMPAGNINLMQNVAVTETNGDLGYDYRNEVFANYYADESGEIRFTDALGKRNINGITNDSTFAFTFDYKVTAIDEAHEGKENGSVIVLRMYSCPSSQGKASGLKVYLLENAISIRKFKEDSSSTLANGKFKRETGKTYKIAIVSSPKYTKVWVDGELVATANFTGTFTFDLRFQAYYTAAEVSNMVLYDTNPNELREIADYPNTKELKTGNTLTDSVDIPLQTRGISIAAAAAGFVAVLSLAGIAVVTVLFIKKKKATAAAGGAPAPESNDGPTEE